MEDIPVAYMVFDVLWLDGHSTIVAALHGPPRSCSTSWSSTGRHWQTPAYHVGDGEAIPRRQRRARAGGRVAKRLDSSYEPGRRTGAWLKIKNCSARRS